MMVAPGEATSLGHTRISFLPAGCARANELGERERVAFVGARQDCEAVVRALLRRLQVHEPGLGRAHEPRQPRPADAHGQGEARGSNSSKAAQEGAHRMSGLQALRQTFRFA